MWKNTTFPTNLKELEMSLFQALQELFRQWMREILEEWDREWMEQRDHRRYQHKDVRKTTLDTIFGPVTFSRRYYRDRQTGKYVYLLDQYLQFDSQKGISPYVEELAMELSVAGPSYRNAAHQLKKWLGYSVVSHETIRKRLLACSIQTKPTYVDRPPKVLFVEVDGLWTSMQRHRKKNQEQKIAVVHEGWKQEGNRTKLVNKKYYHHTGKESFWEGFENFLYENYSYDHRTWLVINGDGASWISACTEYFQHCVFVLDRFHIAKGLRTYLRDHPQAYRKAREALAQYNGKELTTFLRSLNLNFDQAMKGQEWERFVAWVEANQAFIRDYREVLKRERIDTAGMRPMGAAEAMMRTIAGRMKSKGYSWSEKGANGMIRVMIGLMENGVIEPMKQAEKTGKETDMKRNIRKWISQKTTEAIGVIQGHLPLLEIQPKSPSGFALKGLKGF